MNSKILPKYASDSEEEEDDFLADVRVMDKNSKG